LGGIDAILAVPLTIPVLIIMENFEVSHPLAILIRYTREGQQEDVQEMADSVKAFFGKMKGTSTKNSQS
jgi:hypothetical protein